MFIGHKNLSDKCFTQVFFSLEKTEAIFDDFASERRYIQCKRMCHRLYNGSPPFKC